MRKFLLYACPLLLLSTAAWAAPACVTGSMSSYMNMSGGCTFGGFTFSLFSFGDSGTVANLPGSGDIMVTPVQDSSGVGFSFLGPFSATAGTSLDAIIKFVISGAPISGDSLAMSGFGFNGTGSVTVTESLCEGSIPPANGSCAGPTGSLAVSASASGIVPFASISFPATQPIAVTKNIIVNGGSGGASFAGVSAVINTIPGGGGGPGGGQVPEPNSWLLIGSGLVVSSLLLRKRIRKA
jgi:hypothetical protein